METGLLVRRGEGRLWYMEVGPSGLPDALMDGEFAPLSRDTAVEHLCGWAGGELKTIEIVGLWESWNEHLSEGDWQGDTMLLFPLPPARVDEISSLSLETDRGYPVEYHRLFVGMVPLDLL